tara:strand:- start:26735 stop:28210 length:1476 start_codon:yes stop_codon:yes gene_type:complete
MMSTENRLVRILRKTFGVAGVATWALSCGPLPPASGPGGGSGGGGTSAAPLGNRALPAFPGAEGFGAAATGGRGGRVITVTTLNSSGPGSLRAALTARGPRTIVFAVSGVIDAGMLEIPHGNLTIAGQTAPGGGITIRGQLYAAYESGVDNIIMRHLRIRPAAYKGREGQQFDALQLSLSRLVILDHMSIAFGVDENVDLYEADQVTVQWSTIEESAIGGHPEGKHNYGLIQGEDGWEISLHHNLFVHHKSRTPAVANGPSEILNNVSYNCRQGFVHNNNAAGHISIVGNTYRRGPSDEMFPFYFDWDEPGHNLQYYLADNYIDDPKNFTGVVDDPWIKPFVHPAFEYLELEEDGSSRQFRSETPFDIASETESPHFAVTTQPSQLAYEQVLQKAGAFPRDVVTTRDVQEVRDRGGMWGARIPSDLMSGLSPTTAPADSDGDGMPDDWERSRGLDPANGKDHKTVMKSGYTAIETYINERADALVSSGNES